MPQYLSVNIVLVYKDAISSRRSIRHNGDVWSCSRGGSGGCGHPNVGTEVGENGWMRLAEWMSDTGYMEVTVCSCHEVYETCCEMTDAGNDWRNYE